MTRIFGFLATLTTVLLTVTFIVGVMSMLRGSVHNPDDGTYLVHFVLGLSSAVCVLLVHCLIFTYLLGTGRWVKEVGLAYRLPDQQLPKQTRELKRVTFPAALAAMLVTIADAAAGAGAQLQAWPWWVHFGLAIVTLLVNLWAFRVEYRGVRENGIILDEVLREVNRIRQESGLESNEEALRREESKV
ncbi:MAG: hypothetical protein ACK4RK_12140 [Gemmataceae bacterium]